MRDPRYAIRHGAVPPALLDVEALITRLGTTGMTTRFTVRRAADELVIGEVRHVFVDATSWEKTAMPPAVRAALERYAAPA